MHLTVPLLLFFFTYLAASEAGPAQPPHGWRASHSTGLLGRCVRGPCTHSAGLLKRLQGCVLVRENVIFSCSSRVRADRGVMKRRESDVLTLDPCTVKPTAVFKLFLFLGRAPCLSRALPLPASPFGLWHALSHPISPGWLKVQQLSHQVL